MRPLILIGAGGHGRVVADAAEASGRADIAFLDDGFETRARNGVWPIVGPVTAWRDHAGTADILVSIGDNAKRAALFEAIMAVTGAAGLPSIVHPGAHLSRHATLGAGCVVMAGAVVQAFAEIGACAIVNTGATVDHDGRLGSAVHVSPNAGLAGSVRVGDRSWIGIGAAVRQGIAIGADVMVAAGATVVSDVPDGAVVYGTPARARAGDAR